MAWLTSAAPTSVQSARRPARTRASPTIGAHSQTRYWGDSTRVGRTKAKVPRVKGPAQSAGPSPPGARARPPPPPAAPPPRVARARRHTSQAAPARAARVATPERALAAPERLELRS